MAQVIRLLDSSGQNVMDSVSVEYEDSFSLDSFKELSESYHTAEPIGKKEFIIARVQTWDPKQPDKTFYSYYNAFHLNKILFQTQVYLGKKLIHRLQVLNPLTNTDIIGHVQYFKVRVRDQPKKTKQPKETKSVAVNTSPGLTQAQSPSKLNANSSPQTSGTTANTDEKLNNGANSQVEPKKKKKRSIFETKALAIVTTNIQNESSSEVLHPRSAYVKDVEEGNPSWTISAPAAVMVTDDYIVGYQSPTKDQPARRMTILSPRHGIRQFFIPAGTFSPQLYSAPDNMQAPNATLIGYAQDMNNNNNSNGVISPATENLNTKSKRPSKVQNFVPSKPVVLGNLENNKLFIPQGTITRFAIPLNQEDVRKLANPATPTRKRLYSYANMKSATGKVSFDEWLEKVSEDYKKVNPEVPEPPQGLFRESSEKEILEEESNSTLLFDAILFATDTDFLESGRIRAVFRDNALSQEDAALFEMPPFTGEEQTPVRVLMEDPVQCEFCMPSAARLAQMSPARRRFHLLKPYIIVLLIMAIIAMVIVLSAVLRK